MPDTYTQLYINVVFAVKYRQAMLNPAWDQRLRLYITAIIQNNGHKMLCINNMRDHMHMLVCLSPKQSISDLIGFVKGDSSEWINKNQLTEKKFRWQAGFSAFSVSKSVVSRVALYIENQQQHHQRKNFIAEQKMMIESFDEEYSPHHLFVELE
jgi:REP element-mobilizing transposase RayT